MGAGSDLQSLRQSARYATTQDDMLSKLAKDLAVEDKALAVAVDKGRLEAWWPGVVEGARDAVRREADEVGRLLAADEANRRQAEAMFNGDGDGDGEAVDPEGDTTMG